jgi:hypothetical protein
MSKVAALYEANAVAAAASHTAGGNYHQGGKLITKWTTQEVCNWLVSAGFGDVAPVFERHQISGPVLPRINDALLKEMGVDIIGRRVLLMNEVVKVQALARAEWRNTAIWSSEQYREGPCNGTLPFGFPWTCESCVGRPNMYTVTNSKMNILRMEKNCNTPCTGFCGFTMFSDNVDLSDITDVDVAASTAAYGDPTGFIKIRDKNGNFFMLALRSSECQKAAMLITNAKEEATANAAAMTMMR